MSPVLRSGAVTVETIAEYARREDVFNLGIAFAQLMFPNLVERGTDLKRLMVDVFECDMTRMAEYCQVRLPIVWISTVRVLDVERTLCCTSPYLGFGYLDVTRGATPLRVQSTTVTS